MNDNMQKAKGKIDEAAGKMMNNGRLKAKGKIEQAEAEVKKRVRRSTNSP